MSAVLHNSCPLSRLFNPRKVYLFSLSLALQIPVAVQKALLALQLIYMHLHIYALTVTPHFALPHTGLYSIPTDVPTPR